MKKRRITLSAILKNSDFSAFEKDVYNVVAEIPAGEVRSYKWVAARIGRPRAYRAVGSALNKNRYPEVIPCHRVIKTGGLIGGYAKGARLKVTMLKHEGVDCDKMRCYNLKKLTKGWV